MEAMDSSDVPIPGKLYNLSGVGCVLVLEATAYTRHGERMLQAKVLVGEKVWRGWFWIWEFQPTKEQSE